MPKEHEIVFEDLHGAPEQDSAIVDLDADSNETGITRFSDNSEREGAVIDLNDDGHDDDAGDDASRRARSGDKDSKDGEDDGYSERVRKRIQREQRATRKAKDDADYWKQQAEQSSQQLQSMRKKNAESAIERIGGQIESIESQMEAAHEAGNTKDVVKLTSQLTDLKAERYKAEADLEDVGSTETGNDSPESGNVRRKPNDQARLVRKWKDGNDDWYGSDGFERQTRVANRIDKEVFDDGYDPGTPEYYEELNARIKAKMPELFDDDTGSETDDNLEPSRRSNRQPVAPVGRSESAETKTRTSSSRVELNEDDFANMREFGLDPNDPEVLKEYARNKREAEQQERALRG